MKNRAARSGSDDPPSYVPQQDWKESPCAALIEEFGTHHSILKIRGHSNRPDFVYLSDEPGYFTIFRWDPVAGEGAQVIQDDEPITDSAASGDFMLHPCEPWIVYAKAGTGQREHSLYLLNYESGRVIELVHAIGSVEFLISYNAEHLIAVVTTHEHNQLVAISYAGEVRTLYTTDQQVLSVAVSDRHEVVALAVGRGSTEIVILNPRSGTITQRIAETETSKEGCLTIEEESGTLTYTTSAKGDGEEIVIRSLQTFEAITRIAVPGSVGFFDLNYLAWVNDHELLVVVSRDGRVSPRLLNVAEAAWSGPLAEASAIYLTRTSRGIVWVASDFACSEYIQGFREGKVETILPPSFHNRDLVVENHWYRSFDGRKVQGWLMRNALHPGAPLIVMVHGGPTSAVINEWGEPIVQLLVQAGYHVFQPNYRGSTTFGTEFMDLLVGDVGGGDLQDIVYGEGHISELLGLDTKPIIMGVSYGGYLTLQALTTQAGHWAGGVAIVPFSDWKAMYNSADAHYRKYCEHFLGGTPEAQPELYRERSPITHLAHLAEPVLILTGEDDRGYAEVQAFCDTARSLAKPVRLVVQETGHGTSTADQMNAEIVHSLDFLCSLDVSCG